MLRVVHLTQPASRALPSRRVGPNQAMSALNVTGINHWWAYQEDAIGGIGHYMVNVATGNLIVQADDMAIPHKGIELAFLRTYNSYSQHDYANTDGSVPNNYGDGWTNTFDAHIAQNALNDPHCGKTGISVYDIDGARYDYAIQYNSQTQSCSYVAPTGQFAILSFDTTSGLYYWTKKTGTVYMFHNPTDSNIGVAGRLSKIWGRNNNCALTFTYTFDSGQTKSATTLNKITVQTEATGGASLTATLIFSDSGNRRLLHSLTWPDGTTVIYKYNAAGQLTEVDEPANSTGGSSIPQIYAYSATGYLMTSAAGGRWSTSNGTDGQIISFDYSGSSLTDVRYNGWINPTVPQPSSAPGPVQPSVAPNYGTQANLPYRFVTFANSATGITASPAPQPAPSASPCSGTTAWYDSDGHEAFYCWDSSNRVVQSDAWTGTLWLVTKQAWDGSDDLVSATDARGNETDFAYDTSGNLIAQAAPSTSVMYNGQSVQMRPTSLYSYDLHNNVTATCDPVSVHAAGKDWSAMPAPSDTLCSTANGLSNFTKIGWSLSTLSYEPYGEVVSVTKPLGYTASVAYATTAQGGLDYGLPTSITGAMFYQSGSATTPQASTAYDAFGNTVCSSHTINSTTSATTFYQYDGSDRVTAVADPDDGSAQGHTACGKPTNSNTIVTTTTYFQDGSIATTQSPSEAAAGVTTQYTYDADGNKTAELDHFGGTAATTNNYYDAAERLVEVIKPHDASSDIFNLAWATRYYYDLGAGQPDTVVTSGGNSATYSVTGHGGLFATLMYIDTTNGSQTLTPYWAPTQFDSYDAMDRPVVSYRDVPTDCAWPGVGPQLGFYGDCDTFAPSTHTYDATSQTYGLQTSMTQSPTKPELEYSYDSLGRVLAQSSNNVSERTYAFDPDGRDATVTTAGVGQESMGYDADGRLTNLSEPNATGFTAPTTYTYSYYDNGWMAGVTAAPSGSATSIVYGYTYRWDGAPSTTNMTYGSDSYTFSYHQTIGGRETSMDDPYYPGPSPSPSASPCPSVAVDARCETYDAFGRLQTLAIPQGSYGSVGYDPEADITSYSAGGVAVAETYNDRGELYNETSNGGQAPGFPLGQAFGYSGPGISVSTNALIDIRAGVSVHVFPSGESTLQFVERDKYDDQGRETLSAVEYYVTIGGGQWETIEGDDRRSFDDENHLTSDAYTSWNCTGDPLNQQRGLLASPSATYVWGPNDHPIVSTLVNLQGVSETESLHWSGDQLMFTTNASGQVDDVKIGTIADYIPTATTSSKLTVWDRDLSGYIASAHNGTGSALWNNRPVDTNVCAPTRFLQNSLGFGSSATQGFTIPSGLAQVFSGLRYGAFPTGLFIADRADSITNQFSTIQGARAYDPAKNNWMTPDAISGDIADPVSQRAYAYDRNSPYTYSDPSGFDPHPNPAGITDGGGMAPNEDEASMQMAEMSAKYNKDLAEQNGDGLPSQQPPTCDECSQAQATGRGFSPAASDSVDEATITTTSSSGSESLAGFRPGLFAQFVRWPITSLVSDDRGKTWTGTQIDAPDYAFSIAQFQWIDIYGRSGAAQLIFLKYEPNDFATFYSITFKAPYLITHLELDVEIYTYAKTFTRGAASYSSPMGFPF